MTQGLHFRTATIDDLSDIVLHNVAMAKVGML